VNKSKQKLTLDRSVTYEIRVPGQIDERWSKAYENMMIETNHEKNGTRTSSLTCTLDQAALQGLLRRLYSSGIPLISVQIVSEA
jgi:hypothetical protein